MPVPVVLAALLVVVSVSPGCSALRTARDPAVMRGTYQDKFDTDTRTCLLRWKLDRLTYHWCLEDLGWRLAQPPLAPPAAPAYGVSRSTQSRGEAARWLSTSRS
jgi:hypothetical protein